MRKHHQQLQLNRRRGFTLVELLVVITIIGILAGMGLGSFSSAQKKSRDAQRKAHLKQLADALEAYYNDKNQYADDDNNGNLMACGAGAAAACAWGTSSMKNTTTGTVYIVQLPQDPTQGQSYSYQALVSAGKVTGFQIYSRLENTQDIAVNKDASNNPLVFQNLYCGVKLCNYGVSSSNTTPENGRTLVTE